MAIVSSPTKQQARQQLQGTLDDFRSECTQWEGEVTQFFDDLDEFLQSSPPPRVSADSSEITDDLAGLRSLVEQQTDVLTALVDALAGESQPSDSLPPTAADTDEVVEAFMDRVEQLQQLTASGDLE